MAERPLVDQLRNSADSLGEMTLRQLGYIVLEDYARHKNNCVANYYLGELQESDSNFLVVEGLNWLISRGYLAVEPLRSDTNLVVTRAGAALLEMGFQQGADPGEGELSTLHATVREAARVQWARGFPHEAVLAAAKAVNLLLQTVSGRTDVSEQKLVAEAFSDKDPTVENPRLRLPATGDAQTDKSMLGGVRSFGMGCFQAIRNPLGHRPNSEIDIDHVVAREQLSALSLLARWIEACELRDATDEETPPSPA